MSSQKLISNLQAVFLTILTNGEIYGREIRNEYERRTGRKMPFGTLYTTLSRMETAGYVESRMGESAHARGGFKRKYFSITGVGERAHSDYQLFVATTLGGVPNV